MATDMLLAMFAVVLHRRHEHHRGKTRRPLRQSSGDQRTSDEFLA